MNDASSEKHLRKLYNIVTSDYPGDIALIDKLKDGSASFDEKQKLIDIVSEEFINKGLNPDDEPNQYGIELEQLLDILNETA